MMQKQLFDLPEFAEELGVSVEAVINRAAHGHISLCVVADQWAGKSEPGDEKTAITVDKLVQLVPEDLLKSLNAEATLVRQVKTTDGTIVQLDKARTVPRGIHFVTAEERERVREQYREKSVTAGVNHSAPYLDPDHSHYSYTLEAAVSAWMAIYGPEGTRKPRTADKDLIDTWLKANRPEVSTKNARDAIARVVNPRKEGGNPHIRK